MTHSMMRNALRCAGLGRHSRLNSAAAAAASGPDGGDSGGAREDPRSGGGGEARGEGASCAVPLRSWTA